MGGYGQLWTLHQEQHQVTGHLEVCKGHEAGKLKEGTKKDHRGLVGQILTLC